MAKVSVSVTVTGGVPPAGIHVIFTGPSGQTWSSATSFLHSFDLKPGQYQLTIGGLNPIGGQTSAHIMGAFTDGPIPSVSNSSTDNQYIFTFFFTV